MTHEAQELKCSEVYELNTMAKTVWSDEERKLHEKITVMLSLRASEDLEREITQIKHLHQLDTWDCGEMDICRLIQ
jgi:hypothetical protein